MNNRCVGTPPNLAKAQTLEVTYGDRSWIIVNEGQMAYQKMLARELKLCDLSASRVDATDEEIDKMVDEWVANECPYATLDYVLGLMTPAERELWKNNYRFSGIGRPKG